MAASLAMLLILVVWPSFGLHTHSRLSNFDKTHSSRNHLLISSSVDNKSHSLASCSFCSNSSKAVCSLGSRHTELSDTLCRDTHREILHKMSNTDTLAGGSSRTDRCRVLPCRLHSSPGRYLVAPCRYCSRCRLRSRPEDLVLHRSCTDRGSSCQCSSCRKHRMSASSLCIVFSEDSKLSLGGSSGSPGSLERSSSCTRHYSGSGH